MTLVGKYCATYDHVDMNMHFTSDLVSLQANIPFGKPIECANEPYVLYPNGTIGLTNWDSPDDCVRQLCNKFNVETFYAEYEESDNVVIVEFDDEKVKFKSCSKEQTSN